MLRALALEARNQPNPICPSEQDDHVHGTFEPPVHRLGQANRPSTTTRLSRPDATARGTLLTAPACFRFCFQLFDGILTG